MDRRHACPQCDQAFLRPSSVAEHVASVHSDAKPFACPVDGCPYRAKLQKHIAVHLKSKQHASPAPETAAAVVVDCPAWLLPYVSGATDAAAMDADPAADPAAAPAGEPTGGGVYDLLLGQPADELATAGAWLESRRHDSLGMHDLHGVVKFMHIVKKWEDIGQSVQQGDVGTSLFG